MISQPFRARTSEELIALLSAVAIAVLAVLIVTMLYFGREIIIPIALADHGVHELVDDDAARVEAIKLARSLRETRPQLRGSHCSISVTAPPLEKTVEACKALLQRRLREIAQGSVTSLPFSSRYSTRSAMIRTSTPST